MFVLLRTRLPAGRAPAVRIEYEFCIAAGRRLTIAHRFAFRALAVLLLVDAGWQLTSQRLDLLRDGSQIAARGMLSPLWCAFVWQYATPWQAGRRCEHTPQR